MSGYTLIDPPITPYSSKSEILAWIAVCREKLSKEPDSRDWQEALAHAEEMLTLAKGLRAGR